MTTPSTATTNSAPARDQTDEYRPNWKVIVPVVLISATVLLVCLPVCALLIVNSTGCCLADGPEKVVTFWASMIAGFLALFGMLVTGVFVITSLRVEATARAMAQVEAREEMSKYIRRYHDELLENLERLRREVSENGEDAKTAIAKARAAVESAQKNAHDVITRAQAETTNAARQAQDEIGTVQRQTTTSATEAQRAIGDARDQTVSGADEAQGAIRNAQQQAQTAARELRQLADQTRGGTEGSNE